MRLERPNRCKQPGIDRKDVARPHALSTPLPSLIAPQSPTIHSLQRIKHSKTDCVKNLIHKKTTQHKKKHNNSPAHRKSASPGINTERLTQETKDWKERNSSSGFEFASVQQLSRIRDFATKTADSPGFLIHDVISKAKMNWAMYDARAVFQTLSNRD